MQEIVQLYNELITAWNERNAEAMARLFAKQGEMIGYDGSDAVGQEEITAHLSPIFLQHRTPMYICKVKDVRVLGQKVAMLRAIAGMVRAGEEDIDPAFNAHHTLLAVKIGEEWKIELFQNTPAQFHGRPHLVEQMTEELRRTMQGNDV